MSEGDALDVIQSAIWMVIVGAGPAIGAAMAVGIVVALVQALTQIQEMTLTFVPKIVMIFLVVSLTASFVGGQFYLFTENIYAHIEHGFGN
jgi:flagellar biosynthetic protein FliQ